MTRMILALALLVSFNAQAALKIGDALPKGDVAMKATDGKDVKLNDLSKDKKGTLVIFTSNTCPYAKAWKDRIKTITKDAASKGLAVALVNSNDDVKNPKENMGAMLTEGFSVPYVVDSTSDVAREFGAEKTPDVFLFNKDKKLVYKGAVDDNSEDAAKVKEKYLETALGQMLAGQTVKPDVTKSVGCGIKFRSAKKN